MTFSRLNLTVPATTFAMVVLAGVVFALGRPKPIESAMLGPNWQCSRTAFVITTCTQRMVPVERASGKVAVREPNV